MVLYKNLITGILSYSLSIFTPLALATPLLPKPANIPGGVAIVSLDLVSTEAPIVKYQDNRTLVVADHEQANKWLAVIGIPLKAKAGMHQIEISFANESISQAFKVEKKAYAQQKLTIKNKRKVQPHLEDLPIIAAQYLETIKTYEHWDYKPLASLLLDLPVEGRKSSPFGLTRIMNKIPQNPHSGLDLAAPKGTLVKVAKEGKVINTGNFFYSGKIVFVDHGQSFITSYCHLDTILVTKGQILQRGEALGTIGNSGRATGPHLHWSVSLNGVRVDPELFIYG
jgi:murein DD-endopeptidase MepM/ murein hydrolase activator NlpD